MFLQGTETPPFFSVAAIAQNPCQIYERRLEPTFDPEASVSCVKVHCIGQDLGLAAETFAQVLGSENPGSNSVPAT